MGRKESDMRLSDFTSLHTNTQTIKANLDIYKKGT